MYFCYRSEEQVERQQFNQLGLARPQWARPLKLQQLTLKAPQVCGPTFWVILLFFPQSLSSIKRPSR